LLVGHYCEEFGKSPTYVDSCTGDNYQPQSPAVFLLAHSATTTYKYWDAPESDELYCDVPKGSIVVDPWRKFKSSEVTVIHYGNTRQNS
jgi:hypothetical protein